MIVVILLVITSSIATYYFKPNTIKISYPFTFKHYGNDYACEGLIVQGIYTDDGAIDKSRKGIYANNSTENLDTIAISINGDKLDFTTGAGVKAGITHGTPLKIIENSDKTLAAIDRDETGLATPVDVFTMNKDTGLALWSRSLKTGLLTSKDPTSETEYLICR